MGIVLRTLINRSLQERCRPIVFIGHSLGGLIIKQVGNVAPLKAFIDAYRL